MTTDPNTMTADDIEALVAERHHRDMSPYAGALALRLAEVLRENERLLAGIRSIADRPVLREANPYSEIADIQIRAERLLEEQQ